MFVKRAMFSTVACGAIALAIGISPALATTPQLIVNTNFGITGSFVSPGYNPSMLGWTAVGLAGSSPSTLNGGSFWDNGSNAGNPASDTLGFLQTAGSLQQTVTLQTGENYTLSFIYNGRALTGPGDLGVTLGSTTLDTINNIAAVDPQGTFVTPFNTASINFTVSANGPQTLALTNTLPGGVDSTVLVDDVFLFDKGAVSAVPEPGSFALLGAGLLGMLLVVRRHRA